MCEGLYSFFRDVYVWGLYVKCAALSKFFFGVELLSIDLIAGQSVCVAI